MVFENNSNDKHFLHLAVKSRKTFFFFFLIRSKYTCASSETDTVINFNWLTSQTMVNGSKLNFVICLSYTCVNFQ